MDYELKVEMALQLYRTGQYDQSLIVMKDALKIVEKNVGKNDLKYALVLSNVAAILEGKSEYAEAERLCRQAVTIAENKGIDGSQLSDYVTNHGVLLMHLSKYEEAEKKLCTALQIDEKIYGTDHPRIARDLNNLGLLFSNIEKFEKAESYYRRVLKMKSLDGDHSYRAIATRNLAVLLHKDKRSREAEKLFREALRIDQNTFKNHPDHPQIGISSRNLGELLISKRRKFEAKRLLNRSLRIFENQLGKRHPYSIGVRESLNQAENIEQNFFEVIREKMTKILEFVKKN